MQSEDCSIFKNYFDSLIIFQVFYQMYMKYWKIMEDQK